MPKLETLNHRDKTIVIDPSVRTGWIFCRCASPEVDNESRMLLVNKARDVSFMEGSILKRAFSNFDGMGYAGPMDAYFASIGTGFDWKNWARIPLDVDAFRSNGGQKLLGIRQ